MFGPWLGPVNKGLNKAEKTAKIAAQRNTCSYLIQNQRVYPPVEPFWNPGQEKSSQKATAVVIIIIVVVVVVVVVVVIIIIIIIIIMDPEEPSAAGTREATATRDQGPASTNPHSTVYTTLGMRQNSGLNTNPGDKCIQMHVQTQKMGTNQSWLTRPLEREWPTSWLAPIWPGRSDGGSLNDVGAAHFAAKGHIPSSAGWDSLSLGCPQTWWPPSPWGEALDVTTAVASMIQVWNQ